MLHTVPGKYRIFPDPAGDVARARKFYQSLPGWKIEPDTTLENTALEWQNILTGDAKKDR